MCVCVCVRACACVRACVRACERARVYVCLLLSLRNTVSTNNVLRKPIMICVADWLSGQGDLIKYTCKGITNVYKTFVSLL